MRRSFLQQPSGLNVSTKHATLRVMFFLSGHDLHFSFCSPKLQITSSERSLILFNNNFHRYALHAPESSTAIAMAWRIEWSWAKHVRTIQDHLKALEGVLQQTEATLLPVPALVPLLYVSLLAVAEDDQRNGMLAALEYALTLIAPYLSVRDAHMLLDQLEHPAVLGQSQVARLSAHEAATQVIHECIASLGGAVTKTNWPAHNIYRMSMLRRMAHLAWHDMALHVAEALGPVVNELYAEPMPAPHMQSMQLCQYALTGIHCLHDWFHSKGEVRYNGVPHVVEYGEMQYVEHLVKTLAGNMFDLSDEQRNWLVGSTGALPIHQGAGWRLLGEQPHPMTSAQDSYLDTIAVLAEDTAQRSQRSVDGSWLVWLPDDIPLAVSWGVRGIRYIAMDGMGFWFSLLCEKDDAVTATALLPWRPTTLPHEATSIVLDGQCVWDTHLTLWALWRDMQVVGATAAPSQSTLRHDPVHLPEPALPAVVRGRAINRPVMRQYAYQEIHWGSQEDRATLTQEREIRRRSRYHVGYFLRHMAGRIARTQDVLDFGNLPYGVQQVLLAPVRVQHPQQTWTTFPASDWLLIRPHYRGGGADMKSREVRCQGLKQLVYQSVDREPNQA